MLDHPLKSSVSRSASGFELINCLLYSLYCEITPRHPVLPMQTLRTQKKDYGEGQKFCYPISSGIYSYAIFPGTIYHVCAPYLKFPNSKFAIANTSGWTFAHSLAAFLCMLEIDHLPNAAVFCQTMRLYQWEVYIFCSIAFVLYLQSRFQCLSTWIWWCRNSAWTVVGYRISGTKDISLSAKRTSLTNSPCRFQKTYESSGFFDLDVNYYITHYGKSKSGNCIKRILPQIQTYRLRLYA